MSVVAAVEECDDEEDVSVVVVVEECDGDEEDVSEVVAVVNDGVDVHHQAGHGSHEDHDLCRLYECACQTKRVRTRKRQPQRLELQDPHKAK